MEYADNGDLYQKIVEYKKRKIYFEEIDIWKIFIQLVKGLKALHDLRILHRDLKSANVFLFKNGNAKLGDLNVSKVAKRGLGYTQTGTPYYASPEIWKDLPYDNKSDIWSLGCVLYEMITLHPPFIAKNMDDLYKKVLSGDVSALPNKFSNDLYEVVCLLLKINQNKRPNCNEILNNALIKKRIEFFKSMNNNENGENNLDMDDKEEQDLLKTIHIPKNLLFLPTHLPKPNYKKSKIEVIINTNQHKKLKEVRAKLPKLNLNLKANEETKNSLSNTNTITKQNSENFEKRINDNNNNQNNINSTHLEINNEVQFYKKLIAVNKFIKPVKKNKSLDKNEQYEINNYNNFNSNSNISLNLKKNLISNISSKYRKLYKLYEPNTKINEVKKMPKYKILNSLRNGNKYNIYWKNREDIYKNLNKNVGIKSELMELFYKDKSTFDIHENNEGNYSQNRISVENKIFQGKNKLSPICKQNNIFSNNFQ